MDQIYRIDEKHCLIIYAQGSLVLALHTPVYRNARPHILVNDCLHGLTSAMFDHRIYFAYVNIKK